MRLARALAVEPDILLLDEPVSALDPSSAAQILDLLADAQSERGLGSVLVSHDTEVMRALAHRVVVLYAGQVVLEPVPTHPPGLPDTDPQPTGWATNAPSAATCTPDPRQSRKQVSEPRSLTRLSSCCILFATRMSASNSRG